MASIPTPRDLPADEQNKLYGACTWVSFKQTDQHVLILGSHLGDVLAWDLASKDGKEVCFPIFLLFIDVDVRDRVFMSIVGLPVMFPHQMTQTPSLVLK